jgi:sigma-B regulation protein RsbU (phosphoserine phosphatase)
VTGGQHKNVLVVDDSETIRRYLRLTLQRAGYHVRICSDASEACWEIYSNPPDIVVSDWQMSHMNGAELCQWVRGHDLPKYIYFILVTAHQRFFDVVDGLDAGADDYVKKPINVNELLARMRCGQRILRLESETGSQF